MGSLDAQFLNYGLIPPVEQWLALKVLLAYVSASSIMSAASASISPHLSAGLTVGQSAAGAQFNPRHFQAEHSGEDGSKLRSIDLRRTTELLTPPAVPLSDQLRASFGIIGAP